MLAIPPGGLVAALRASDDSFAFLVQTLPLNTEPGAVATGCKHSTTTETAIKDEFSLGPGRYSSRFCIERQSFDVMML